MENGLSRLTEAIRLEEEVLENLEAEREHYRNWKELNDVKRILEYLHRNREQMFVSVKLLEVLLSCLDFSTFNILISSLNFYRRELYLMRSKEKNMA